MSGGPVEERAIYLSRAEADLLNWRSIANGGPANFREGLNVMASLRVAVTETAAGVRVAIEAGEE